MEKQNKKDQEEWLRLVHEGSCCAYEDPMIKEKKAFLESLSKTKSSKVKEKAQKIEDNAPI